MLSNDLIQRYHADPESVYGTWFLDEERLRFFRVIRRGIQVLVLDLEAGTFANDYRGSTLEAVIEAIAEQKQIFAGAAHPFYWKPKLRIPDIYESRPNQQRYAQLLQTALRTSDPGPVTSEILRLVETPIKGLGPATGNLLYFLHPTVFPPFNTAIVKGYNLLAGDNLKLGDWQAYLRMRAGMLQMTQQSAGLLSKDLGDVAGLCFEVGSARMMASELPEAALAELRERWEKEAAKRHKEVQQELKQDQAHAEQQAMLAKLGKAWGCDVWIARNDHNRRWSGGRLGELSVPSFKAPGLPPEVRDTVSLIDVLWLDPTSGDVTAAFEVEKSTSIYSGILRLYDLALTAPACQDHLYLVAPAEREREVVMQLSRPSLSAPRRPEYLLFEDLACHCDSMARFGTGLETLKRLSRRA